MKSLHVSLARTLTITAFGLGALFAAPLATVAQHDHGAGTPAATWTCEAVASATPPAADEGHDNEHGDHGETAAFDQLYIDMMLPHHGSVIALAEAALPHLTDPRLIEMAGNIIEAQTAENELLTSWRTEWYGSGEPATDEASMTQMLEAMPVGTMEEMMFEMDAAAQVSTFCAAENPDIAFVEQVMSHHQMAVDASVVAVEQAVHPELAAFAEEVIVAQEAEIATLMAIRDELIATPAS